MAKNKNKNYDRDLLLIEGFDDVPSVLAALNSQNAELRAIEKDYDALINKYIALQDQLAQAHGVIVSQAIQIHNLTNGNSNDQAAND